MTVETKIPFTPRAKWIIGTAERLARARAESTGGAVCISDADLLSAIYREGEGVASSLLRLLAENAELSAQLSAALLNRDEHLSKKLKEKRVGTYLDPTRSE